MKRILTAAALAAALLSSAPRAAAACPYKVGPLGRYIAPAIVNVSTRPRCTRLPPYTTPRKRSPPLLHLARSVSYTHLTLPTNSLV